MSSAYLLEIACNSAMSAVAAQHGGANRIELFENLEQGGTTPSLGSIAVAREQLQIPLFVLIRPRPGDFHYGSVEAEIMLRDIRHCRQLGCDGVVIGALTVDAEIDMTLCRELVSAAGPMDITFHRAFDAARDLPTALEQIAGLGIKRILSSGGHASAAEGSAVLSSLAEQAGSRLALMAGAGLSAQNITEVALKTGCVQLHASAKGRHRSAMRYQNPRLQGLDNDWIQTQSGAVAALREALDQLG